MKKETVFLFSVVFLLLFIAGVYAQENSSQELGSPEFEDETAELQETEGITPDSALYFFDEFLDRFGDDVKIREEKIAEIKVMIQEGKIDEARIALETYRERADNLEREVSPEQREEARRSAAAIYNSLREIEDQIPEGERGDFFDDVVERESKIVTAVEIAGKIKELCETLSEIDPLEYSRVCKTSEDAPEWQKRLDRDLTDKQREEAEKFGRIMQQCFETSGQECACEEIPFSDFAETCLIAAPLATACEIENNEEACEQLDEIEMPELPDHLQDVFDNLERDIAEAQFDLHMPRECREAGATSPRECMRIMVQTHAPEECREAILDANVQSEREARAICEEIMFEQNAPQECIEAGLSDHRECGKLLFELNAPQECIEAGITGENRNDPKKCEEIMRNFEGGEGNFRGGFGGNCRGIENPEERLRCYDGAASGVQEHREDFEERFREINEAQRQCAESCLSRGAAWDFSNGNCECHFPEEFDDSQFREDFGEEEFEEISPEERCGHEGGSWDGSTCVFDNTAESSTTSESGEVTEEPETTEDVSAETDESDSSESEEIAESGGTTASVIAIDKFYDYYFR